MADDWVDEIPGDSDDTDSKQIRQIDIRFRLLIIGLGFITGIVFISTSISPFLSTYNYKEYSATMIILGLVFLLFSSVYCIRWVLKLFKREKNIISVPFAKLLLLAIATGLIFMFLELFLFSELIPDFDYTRFNGALIYSMIALLAGMIIGWLYSQSPEHGSKADRNNIMTVRTGPDRKKQMMITFITTVCIILLLILLPWLGNFDKEWWEDLEPADDVLLNSEHIGGRYNADIELWYGRHEGSWDRYYRINYEVDGEQYKDSYFPQYEPAYEWLENSTLEDERVMCWWDYGHSIRGYAGRDVVIDSPSRSLEDSIYDISEVDKWEEDETKVVDASLAIIGTDPSEVISIMKKYNATYLFTTSKDRVDILYAFFIAPDIDMGDYVDMHSADYIWDLTDMGEQMTIVRIWNNEDIEGFDIVYSDLDVKILKLSDRSDHIIGS